MSEKQEPREHQFGEVKRADNTPTQHLDMTDLREVRLAMAVDLGTCNLLVREVLDLKEGAVIRLNKIAGETTDIHVGGQLIAKGEVVVIGDALHVRISEILGAEERTEEDAAKLR